MSTPTPTLTLTLNGTKKTLSYSQGETLAQILRDRLTLTGTKVGCDEGACGTCTVLVDGKPRRSCVFPAERAEGTEVLTIEGLAALVEGDLHPLQEAFVTHGAVQCGFCSPGQIMNAHALLEKNPNPDHDQIHRALRGALCRCGGYPSIESAVEAAAHALRTGEPVPAPTLSLPVTKKGVGSLQPRPDAVEKVTGAAKFTADLEFPNMLHAQVKRAEIPHAILHSVDVGEARELPGVVAILTARDLPGAKTHGLFRDDWPILVGEGERIRYVGDAVAVVAAESREAASAAVDAIRLTLDPQPVIDHPVPACRADAPHLHPDGNLLKHIKVRKGEPQEGFESADVVMEHTFHTATMEHAFLEVECSLARPTEDGRMEVYVGSQIPYEDRRQVAEALGWERERVRVIGQLVGGAFGGKEDIAGQIHAALLAQATGRSVKLEYSRRESLMAHPKRHATQIRVKVGAKKDGRLTAVETELYGDTGAYASLGEKVMARATTHSSGAYQIPHVWADCYAMYTNNPPGGAFRGFGALQAIFAVESMMDRLAETLSLDPVELRRINALRVGSVTNTGQTLTESVGLLDCIEKVEGELRRVAGPEPFTARPVPGAENKRRAWGFSIAYKNTGLGGGAVDAAGAEVELHHDGHLAVRTASAEIGQGLVTVLRLIVADQFDLSPDLVDVLVMDTDLTPDGGPTTASRQSYVAGNAARYAAQSLKREIREALEEEYNVPAEQIRFAEGKVILGDEKHPLSSVAEIMVSQGRELTVPYHYTAPETMPLGQGGDMHFAFGFGVQAVEVEVDTRTGKVKVLRVIAANDVGKILNPLGLQGQIEGGIVMGLGHTLTEKFELEEGIVKTERLGRYGVPKISDTPEITAFTVEHPTGEGPYGAKGVGELVAMPTIPAITNAIYNAVGVRIDRIPVERELLKA